jgi:hypothetical protein
MDKVKEVNSKCNNSSEAKDRSYEKLVMKIASDLKNSI